MLVVQILIAFAVFTTGLFFADRWASSCTTEDRIELEERRRAHRAARAQRRRVPVVRSRARTRRPAAREPFAFAARRPIQVVAADLRRLSKQLSLVPSGSTLVRWKALWAAYDGVLIEASAMLELPHELTDQPPGLARDIERLRVLAALEEAGLVVHG
jgi:hypothetical protein